MRIPDDYLAIAEDGTAAELFQALDRMAQDAVGATIFTCSTFNPATRQARRVYTNQPQVYPLSGMKDIDPGPWTETVLQGGRTFVANTIEGVAEVFPDHELIAGLGCGSAVNLPVKLGGLILGTVNLLHAPHHFTPERVDRVMGLRPAAIIAFAAMGKTRS